VRIQFVAKIGTRPEEGDEEVAMSQVDSKARVWKKIGVFYALTLLLSIPFWYFLAHARGNFLLVAGLMWAPGLAAILTQLVFAGGMQEVGWSWEASHYRRLAYLIPLLYVLPVYMVVWISGLGGFDAATFVHGVGKDFGLTALPIHIALAAYVLIALTAGFIGGAGGALGEELGWRGFLVPELAKVNGFTGIGLISGILWAIWHYPLIFYGGYNANIPAWYAIGCFTVMLVAAGFIAAWLRLRSGSIWPAVIFHASHNMFIQLIFTPMTVDTGDTAYFIDEFGIGLVITCVIGAFLVWRKRGELSFGIGGRR
jgi:membrane protease YdiL (CAAX protease family)